MRSHIALAIKELRDMRVHGIYEAVKPQGLDGCNEGPGNRPGPFSKLFTDSSPEQAICSNILCGADHNFCYVAFLNEPVRLLPSETKRSVFIYCAGFCVGLDMCRIGTA
jgi:hypothetical protein